MYIDIFTYVCMYILSTCYSFLRCLLFHNSYELVKIFVFVCLQRKKKKKKFKPSFANVNPTLNGILYLWNESEYSQQERKNTELHAFLKFPCCGIRL